MIETVEIKNLRGIREGRIDGLTALSVLVGRNGCGKSTVLDALAMVAMPTADVGMAALRRRGTFDQQLGPRWLIRRGADAGSCTIGAAGGKSVCLSGRASDGDDVEFFVTDTSGPSQVIPPGGRATTAERAQASFVLHPSGGASGRTGASPRFPPQPANVRFIDMRSFAKTRIPPDELYSEARTTGRKAPVLALVKSLVPGVEDLEILKIEGNPSLCLSYPDTAIPLSLAGDGIRNVVLLAFELGAPPGTLILIEEPETHLHPGAMQKAAEAMVLSVLPSASGAEPRQLVLATHSLEFIDALAQAAASLKVTDLLSVHRLAQTDGVLSVSSFSGELVAAARGEVEQDLR